MNQTNLASLEMKLFSFSEWLNFHLCFVLILIGLAGNLITIYLLKTKSKYDLRKSNLANNQNNKSRPRSRTPKFSTTSSSQMYMLALALSDSLFLLSHFVEDIIPSINKKMNFFNS